MANIKITELNAASSLAATDVVPVVDVSADETKKITATDLFRTLPDGTAAAPALAFSSDQANGVYLAGTDTVGISTGGTQRVTVDGSGNVTISGDLTVSGATTTVESTTVTIDDKNIELGSVASPSNTTADGGGITLKGATDKTLKWINSTGCWTFNQPMNFNDHVRIDSSGRVGIGTTSPSQLLHLNGTNPFIYVEADSTTGNSGITFADGANKGQIMYDHDGDYMRFSTNGSSNERLRIDSSGKVGIGTTSASDKLSVAGSSSGEFRALTLRNSSGSTNSTASLTFEASSGTEGDTAAIAAQIKGVRLGSGTSGGLQFWTANAGTPAERMRIDSSGRLLVGTSSSSAATRLVVKANSASSSGTGSLYLLRGNTNPTSGQNLTEIQMGNGNANMGASILAACDGDWTDGSDQPTRLVFSTTANGASSPTERLRIDSSGRLIIMGPSASATNSLDLFYNGTSGIAQINADSSGGNTAITFGTSSSGSLGERLRIDSSGRLLAGTSTAGNNYRVTGTNYTPQVQLVSNTVFGLAVNRTNGDANISIANSGTAAIDNTIGRVTFNANDGTNLLAAAHIVAQVDGTPGSNDMPGRLVFSTTADGASSPTERMRIDSSGNVGIGTTSPGVNLEIVSTSINSIAKLKSNQSTNGAQIGVNNTDFIVRNRDNGYMSFWTNDSERLRIDSSGNVGIGSTAPGHNLEVKGSFPDFAIVDSDTTNDKFRILHNGGGTQLMVDPNNVGPNASYFLVSVDGSERARIDSSGRLLVGTTSSSSAATIVCQGSSSSATQGSQIFMQRGQAAASISSGDTLGRINFADNAGGVYALIEGETDGTGGSNDYPGRIVLATTADSASSPTERLRITSTGAWAIEGASNYGTSGQVLTSNGNDSPTWQDASGGGASAINDLSDAVTNSSGKTIGLGTDALANDDGTTNYNTALGYQALQDNTSGNNNVGIGAQAGRNLTTGARNIAIGVNALDVATEVTDTVAVGYAALNANTTGNDNVAVGKDALKVNTTGSQNVAVGGTALDANTTGNYHTAIGYNALGGSTTGVANTAMGRNALASNTTASYNTAIGYSTLFSNVTGTFNTALGYDALYNNTGSNNTGIGYQAGRANTSGENNVFVGKWSGRGLTTGSSNVGVGNETFESSNTGSNNVAVGHQALTANSSGHSNAAVGTGAMVSNTTGHSNAAVGYHALDAGSGSGNIAIGYEALTSHTQNNNVAVGYQAMKSSTTGGQNTAVGDAAMRDGSGFIHCVAVGAEALQDNIAHRNVAVGYHALKANTSGQNQTALGHEVLTATTTGGDNVGLGYHALKTNTTGLGNVCTGNSSGQALTTGNNNVCNGRGAGLLITTGSENTLIGRSAGENTGPVTGSRNTLIGLDARTSSSSVSNELVVSAGASQTGKGNATAFISAQGGPAYQGNNSSSWSTTSDRRLKKNIVDNTTGLAAINDIRVRNFEYRLPEEITELSATDAIDKSGVQLGVIAQELEEVLPDCVKTESTGVKSVDPDNLTWYLVNAVKELSAENVALKARLDAAGI